MEQTTATGPIGGRNAYLAAIRRLRPAFAAAAAFSAIVNVLMLTGSIYMLQVYDRVLGSGSVATLAGLFAIVVVLYAFLAFYDYLRSRILVRAATRLDRDIAATTFRAWVRSGREATAAEEAQPLRDLETLRGFIGSPAVTGVFDLPWMPLYLAILFLVHPWLGWLTVFGAVVVLGLAIATKAVTQKSMMRVAALDDAERRFSDRSQSLAGALLPMGMEGALTRRWQGLHNAVLSGNLTGGDMSEALAAGSRAFRMLLQSAILTIGALLVIEGKMSGGMIIAASIISGRALAPLDQLIGHWRSIGKSIAAHRRLTQFFDGATADAAAAPVDLPRPTGRIDVVRLSKFGPAKAGSGGDRSTILSQISFALEPGDGLGVIGNSASGKSTLARLLAGAWTADAGEIRLDGATRDQWAPDELGRAVGYLPQTVELLPGTVRDNICRFDPEARSEDVIEAARMAGVHDMILALPDGYATEVGGQSTPLSGGQIQRLGLARALYLSPSILILDEPNSNLDASGDAALTRAILSLREGGSTVIVMAHRPSALAAVNKVMVLQSGQMVEFGNKDEILGQSAGSASLTAKMATVPAARPATAAPAPAAPAAGKVTDIRGPQSRGATPRIFSSWKA